MFKALLNDEGKKVWGYAFPKGEISVKSPVSEKAKIIGLGKEISVYMVDWAALTPEQRTLVLEHLKSRFGDSTEKVEKAILKSGLPIQAKYIMCTSIPARFLL